MAKSFTILLQEAIGIRDEVRPGYNSAPRVGTLFKDIIDKIIELHSGSEADFSVRPTSIVIPQEGGTKTITVNSGTDWTVRKIGVDDSTTTTTGAPTTTTTTTSP